MRKYTVLSIAVIVVSMIAFAVIMAVGITATPQNDKDGAYVLKSYQNSVALYIDDKIIEVYDTIVLNTLPEKDINELNHGIAFDSLGDALRCVEDFDG